MWGFIVILVIDFWCLGSFKLFDEIIMGVYVYLLFFNVLNILSIIWIMFEWVLVGMVMYYNFYDVFYEDDYMVVLLYLWSKEYDIKIIVGYNVVNLFLDVYKDVFLIFF